MELTPELIDAWKWELAVQVQRCNKAAVDANNGLTYSDLVKKADILEGAYTILTCLERAMSGKKSPSPY
jgi:hypothetical protein